MQGAGCHMEGPHGIRRGRNHKKIHNETNLGVVLNRFQHNWADLQLAFGQHRGA